ncbi:hypothetical protein GCM10023322_68690 [Rugosimonospora acidiphila]|uniref:TadE-like protein n=1 Tax=Rugosimonospora acidiphila TaxID=556531 RepID=A0ABP9SL91_9ACTN
MTRAFRHRLARLAAAPDRGVAAAEWLIIGLPVALLLLGLAMIIIRGESAGADLTNAASAASRAASLQLTPGRATAAARRTATADLTSATTACRKIAVAVDTHRFAPGGAVTVTVACTISLSDLPIPTTPTRRLSATATSPVDVYGAATS